MAEIINLKDVRKQRARAEAEAQATENRTRFGRTRAERSRQTIDEHRTRRDHDGNRLERPAADAKKTTKDSDTPDGGDRS
jgi:hypothetical protein